MVSSKAQRKTVDGPDRETGESGKETNGKGND